MDRSRFGLIAIALSVISLALSNSFAAAHRDDDAYRQIALISIPGAPLNSFDISWVDRSSQTYYLADRSNKGIDIVNARNNSFVSRIGGFAGFNGSNDTAGAGGGECLQACHARCRLGGAS